MSPTPFDPTLGLGLSLANLLAALSFFIIAYTAGFWFKVPNGAHMRIEEVLSKAWSRGRTDWWWSVAWFTVAFLLGGEVRGWQQCKC
ncbi:hypothetical protein GQ43DRAFT_437021 [Delitschia confertaspora ATCC 74209]|uniref:Uncharacterized protein n=1 Tax=Delitschia confertaspora ATCC 74209 TaxID=1513339 RepID=A0A9P4JTP9_9PLEO|nr:hypothetical protein GQ43DRAFT_437021 [Delitschia confertaspora ATCC 74209]